MPHPAERRRQARPRAPARDGDDRDEDEEGCAGPRRQARQEEQGRGAGEEGGKPGGRADLGVRKSPDQASAEGQVGREPAARPREARRRSGQDRVDHRSRERESEQRCDDRRGERIARHREEWNGAELEVEDGSGRNAARSRHGQGVGEPPREGIALEPPDEVRDDQEDRRDGGERQLESRVEERVRVPRKQDRRPDEEEVPPVGRPGRQPRERGEGPRDAGANDRGLPAHREHVRRDAEERAEVARPARQAREPGEEKHAGNDVEDVLARHSQQVVEAGNAEVVLQALRQARDVAEHDRFDERAPLACQPAGEGRRHRTPERVAQPTDAAPAPNGAERARSEDDVNPLPPQVRGLVEAAGSVSGRRESDDGGRHDQRALGWRPLRREFEPGRLVDSQAVDAEHAHRDVKAVPAAARRTDHHQAHGCARAGTGRESAPIEQLEPVASPPPAGEEQSPDERRRPPRSGYDREHGEHERADRGRSTRRRGGERGREPKAHRAGEQVRGRNPLEHGRRNPAAGRTDSTHRSTRGLRSCRRAGPIPGTASSSSTEWKAPCCRR